MVCCSPAAAFSNKQENRLDGGVLASGLDIEPRTSTTVFGISRQLSSFIRTTNM